MNKILQKATDYRALGMTVEEPMQFEIETSDGKKKTLSIYPFSLGRLALISQRLIDLELVLDEEAEDPVRQMWAICSAKARQVAEIIAIATLHTKEEIDTQLEERTDEILWSPSMTPKTMSIVLQKIAQISYYGDFSKAIRLARILLVDLIPKTKVKQIAHTEGKPFGDVSTKS